MSKKSSKAEDVVSLLKDEKVAEWLVEKMEEMIEKKLDSIIEKVLLKLNPIIELKVKAYVEVHQEKLQNQITELVSINNKLRSRLDATETESRATNLMIHGLKEPDTPPATKDEAESEPTQAVLNLFTSIYAWTLHLGKGYLNGIPSPT